MTENTPDLWRSKIPVPSPDGHKYDRGHLIVVGGSRLTGAARLAGEAAMRMGAGLCTIVADPKAQLTYQEGAPHLMFEPMSAQFLDDPRRNAVVIGPGADEEGLRELVLEILATGKAAVLDASALTCFKDDRQALVKALHSGAVLTPHEGEFKRLFPDLPGAPEAAKLTGATVLLKGAETVIASPAGQVIVNRHASPYLATAGSGDVLAGMIGGLLAQGVEGFDAACMAAWMHGEAALRHGPGLVAPDLVAGIPAVLAELIAETT
jgi:NAD(P)H-hydrate epimerase